MHQMPHQALESQPRRRPIQLLRAQGPVQGRDGTGDANETAMVWLASAAPKKSEWQLLSCSQERCQTS